MTAEADGGAPALEVIGVRVRHGDVEVVRGIDLSVERGRIVALLGPSGAGKSSLFRAIVGEALPAAGVVRIGGRDLSRAPLWRRARAGLGYLPQGPSVLHDLTVDENVATFARLVSRERASLEPLIELFDLAARRRVRAGALSGGERRRLELLRVMSAQPRVVVCDEPFSGVGPASVSKLAAILRELATARGVAIVLSDHRVGDALSIADEALLLVDGTLEVRATPLEFRADPRVRALYLGDLDERRAL